MALSASPLHPTEAARLVLAFCNTRPVGSWPERYPDGPTAAAWWAQTGLLPAGTVVGDADAAAAREVRDALVVVLAAHSGAPTDPHAEQTLLRHAQRHLLQAEVGTAGVRLAPSSQGFPGLLARVLAASAELALAGRWQRMKVCLNSRCTLAFYDRSRNTSASYCSTGSCGSQVAMRALRARRRQQPN